MTFIFFRLLQSTVPFALVTKKTENFQSLGIQGPGLGFQGVNDKPLNLQLLEAKVFHNIVQQLETHSV